MKHREVSNKMSKDTKLVGKISLASTSRGPLYESNQPVEDDELKLRRLFNDQESIQRPLLIGSGEHGVAILIVVKDFVFSNL